MVNQRSEYIVTLSAYANPTTFKSDNPRRNVDPTLGGNNYQYSLLYRGSKKNSRLACIATTIVRIQMYEIRLDETCTREQDIMFAHAPSKLLFAAEHKHPSAPV